MLVSFFSSSIPLCNEKNPVEKLCNFLEMESKTYTPVGPDSFLRKSDLNFCMIQHDFIRQHPGFSKDQISMFKSPAINYLMVI